MEGVRVFKLIFNSTSPISESLLLSSKYSLAYPSSLGGSIIYARMTCSLDGQTLSRPIVALLSSFSFDVSIETPQRAAADAPVKRLLEGRGGNRPW